MKTISAFALSLLLAAGVVPQLSAAAQLGVRERSDQTRDRVCVYQDIQYRGWEQCYAVGDEVGNLGSRTKAISSIRVYGRARITVWEDPGFHGNSADFTSDVPDLGLRANGSSHTWNDQIESLKIESDYSARRDVPSDNRRDEPVRRPNQINEGICVYDRPEYQGREQCWTAGVNVDDLRRAGNWSDRISSIRVYGRAMAILYRDIGLRGENIVIDRDMPDLALIRERNFRSWNNQISSLAVENERGRGRARGRF